MRSMRLTRKDLLKSLVVLVLYACATTPSQAAKDTTFDVPFKTLAGRATTLRDYAGQVVVVHVFTSWDVPGLRQVPELGRLLAERKKDVAVVGVGLDMEGALALTSFERTFKPGYPLWLPDAALVAGRTPFGQVQEVPRLYILGRDGTVRQGYVGYVPYADLIKMVDAEIKRR